MNPLLVALCILGCLALFTSVAVAIVALCFASRIGDEKKEQRREELEFEKRMIEQQDEMENER